MKKNKIISLIVTICMLLASIPVVAANDNITVYLDSVRLSFDVPPQIIDGRTMVPMRKIFESLGAVVTWDEATQTVTGKKGDIIVNVSINSKTLFKNSVPKVLDVAPVIIDGRTLVPARAIAESFDCTVDWIAESRTVKISTNGGFTSEKTTLSASEIAERVAPSVFYIEVYDERSKALGSGSGFFISSDGVAVTNYHVIEDTRSAQITTVNGDKFNVVSVIAFDEELDVAIIRVGMTSTEGKTVSGFSSVDMGDSDTIKAGQTVYALGSPAGLQNVISNGIISNPKQMVDGDTFIQITAAISHGSSGGVLVDEYGEVLGITSAGITDAENIGFAIPINIIKMFDMDAEGVAYENFEDKNSQFILELSKDVIELNVGQFEEIYVHAEGNGDWSIYWDTKQESIVECEWGDWLEDNDSVCTLKLTGLSAGTATVTVYSDVDFQGKDITVYVKGTQAAAAIYPGVRERVPTYTAVTGLSPIDYKVYEKSEMYAYPFYDINQVYRYIDYLQQNGFAFYEKEEDPDFATFMYTTPRDSLISIVVAYKWDEVWIYIPRF